MVDTHTFKVKPEERDIGSIFKCEISNLEPGKHYFVRASAENQKGSGQRNQVFGPFSAGSVRSVGDADGESKPPAKKAKVAHDGSSSSNDNPAEQPAEPRCTEATVTMGPTLMGHTQAPAAAAKPPAAAAKAPAAAPAAAPKASGSKVPKIKMPTIDIDEDKVCTLLLKDVLEHEDVANTSHKGDLLEHICSKVLPTSAAVSDEKVVLVGAHISGGGGCGDGGKDLIVWKEGRPWVIDCKAYMDGNNVTAKDVRSVMGALMCLPELSSSPATGLVITTSKFTAPAIQAAEDFNERNKSANNKEIELWDGQRLAKEMKKAIKKHGGPAAWCITVLSYLEQNNLITLEKSKS